MDENGNVVVGGEFFTSMLYFVAQMDAPSLSMEI